MLRPVADKATDQGQEVRDGEKPRLTAEKQINKSFFYISFAMSCRGFSVFVCVYAYVFIV